MCFHVSSGFILFYNSVTYLSVIYVMDLNSLRRVEDLHYLAPTPSCGARPIDSKSSILISTST